MRKKKILDEIFEVDHIIDETQLEKIIETGKIKPINAYVNSQGTDAIKLALCKTIVDFKNRKKLKQKDLVEILNSDKSTISLVCSYSIKERLSESRLFSLVQKVIQYENSYKSLDKLNRYLKEAIPLAS